MTVIYEKPTILITQDGISGNRANAFIDEMNAGVAATAADRVQTGLDRSASAASAAQAALYDGPKVDTFAELASVTPSMLDVGEYIRVISTGAVYQRVASGGDLDYSGAGGVNLLSESAGIGRIARAFGVLGGSVSGDRAALNRVIAALNRSATADTVTLTETLTIDGPLDRITKSGKYFQCYGAEINHDGGTLFTFGTGVTSSLSGGGVMGLRYLVPVSVADINTCFMEQDGANRLVMKDIEGRFNKVWRGGMTGAEAGGYLADNINAGSLNNGQVLFEHGIGSVSQMRNVVLTANGVNRVFDESTLTGATAVFAKFGSNRWDTMLWDNILTNGYSDGLLVDRTAFAKNVSNGKFTNVYFDFCARGITLKNTAGGGGINNLSFSGGWVVGMDGHGIHLPAGSGSHRNISFRDFDVLLSGKNGIRLESSGMDCVKFDNVKVWFSNRLNPTNTGNDRDDFVALAGGWEATNSHFGKSANNIVVAGVPNWQGRYGATIASNIGPYKFVENTIEGLTSSTQLSILTTTPAGNARACIVERNMVAGGATAPSYAASSVLSAPTSGVLQTNLTPFRIGMHVFGGTVSQVQHESVQIGAAGGADFVLMPGETWQINYTVAPTITRTVSP